MAYYAVDKSGEGYIYSNIPVRNSEKGIWNLSGGNMESLNGNKLLGIDTKWEDEPVEIVTRSNNEKYIKVEDIGSGDELDIIYGIKHILTKKVREELVKFMGEDDVKLIPATEHGSIFCLDVTYSYRRFYFRAIIYKDESFNFLGYKEDDRKVPFILSEHDLPDGGLLAVLDYLLTGIF